MLAFSADYLRDGSGSRAHEPDDDAEGTDPDRVRELNATTRTMRERVSIFT
jgi:hypothetical protein